MNGGKITDCITILNRLLKAGAILNHNERKELLNFFVEEKIKSIRIYEPDVYDKSQKVLLAIKAKKEILITNQQYDEVARIRDLEKSYEHIAKVIEEFKRLNLSASFKYANDDLSLIIVEGEYDYTIEELKNLGLHLLSFSQILDKIKLSS